MVSLAAFSPWACVALPFSNQVFNIVSLVLGYFEVAEEYQYHFGLFRELWLKVAIDDDVMYTEYSFCHPLL